MFSVLFFLNLGRWNFLTLFLHCLKEIFTFGMAYDIITVVMVTPGSDNERGCDYSLQYLGQLQLHSAEPL